MSTTVNGVGGMRLVHPNSVSGDMMVMGFLDQAGEKKSPCENPKLAVRVGSSPRLSHSSYGDIRNTSELVHKPSPLQTWRARGLQ